MRSRRASRIVGENGACQSHGAKQICIEDAAHFLPGHILEITASLSRNFRFGNPASLQIYTNLLRWAGRPTEGQVLPLPDLGNPGIDRAFRKNRGGTAGDQRFRQN